MSAIRYELRARRTEPGLIDELAATHPRIGMDGLLRQRGRRVWPGRVPAEAAVEGFRWGLVDGWSLRWWPQGIEALDAGRILIVSWFAQKGRGPHQGARITVVDRRDPRRPRAHHVLLVEPVRDGSTVKLRAVDIHAGGLALVGTRLFAAATFGGLRVFDLDDILQLTGTTVFGYRCVLPQSGHERLHGGRGDERMRFSFVSVERGSAGDAHRLVVGEFGPHRSGRRLARVPVPELVDASVSTTVTELQEPGIPRMQGSAIVDGVWFVSASNGVKPGDLWVGAGGGAAGGGGTDATWTRHPGVLPPGPEDLAATPDGGRLWSLCEYPRHRWVYSIDPGRWRGQSSTRSVSTHSTSGGGGGRRGIASR